MTPTSCVQFCRGCTFYAGAGALLAGVGLLIAGGVRYDVYLLTIGGALAGGGILIGAPACGCICYDARKEALEVKRRKFLNE
jgi:hypothetical protein